MQPEQLPEFEFDEQWYLAANPGVARAVKDGQFQSGLQHYVLHGRAEGRPPLPPKQPPEKTLANPEAAAPSSVKPIVAPVAVNAISLTSMLQKVPTQQESSVIKTTISKFWGTVKNYLAVLREFFLGK